MRGKLLAILITAAVTAPLAFYAGGVRGFGDGYGAAEFVQDGSAVRTVFMLRKLRGGEVEPAVEMLEMQLDGLLEQRTWGRSGYDSVFNLPRVAGVRNLPGPSKGLASIVKYRAEFPSSTPPPGKEAIDAALADLARESAGKE